MQKAFSAETGSKLKDSILPFLSVGWKVVPGSAMAAGNKFGKSFFIVLEKGSESVKDPEEGS
jgi:hypothetical protein